MSEIDIHKHKPFIYKALYVTLQKRLDVYASKLAEQDIVLNKDYILKNMVYAKLYPEYTIIYLKDRITLIVSEDFVRVQEEPFM